VHKLGSAFFLCLQGFRENGKMKCLCYGNGIDEPELLVKNGSVDQAVAVAFIQRADQVRYVGRKKKARK
jgi:hypothetical protein